MKKWYHTYMYIFTGIGIQISFNMTHIPSQEHFGVNNLRQGI